MKDDHMQNAQLKPGYNVHVQKEANVFMYQKTLLEKDRNLMKIF